MTIWEITDDAAARDLRVDTDIEARKQIGTAVPAAPDFTKMRGPANRIIRRFAGRNN